jgi:hypothetical protein
MAESRNYGRAEVSSGVYLSEFTIPNNGKEFLGNIVNISGGGALLKCGNYFETGTLLKLKMMIGGWDRYIPLYHRIDQADYSEPLVSLATVKRIEQKEGDFFIAVNFEAIDNTHQESLDKFIMEYKKG